MSLYILLVSCSAGFPVTLAVLSSMKAMEALFLIHICTKSTMEERNMIDYSGDPCGNYDFGSLPTTDVNSFTTTLAFLSVQRSRTHLVIASGSRLFLGLSSYGPVAISTRLRSTPWCLVHHLILLCLDLQKIKPFLSHLSLVPQWKHGLQLFLVGARIFVGLEVPGRECIEVL